MTLEDTIVAMLYVAGRDAQKRGMPRYDRRTSRVFKSQNMTLLRCLAGLRDQLAERDLLT